MSVVTLDCYKTGRHAGEFHETMLELLHALTTDLALLQNGPTIENAGAAAIAVGLAALGAGYAEQGIGAAAVGAIAEDRSMLGPGIVLTVLPETLVIFAIVVIFLV